jgi:D-glycero-D-manno-heptose 1,7-bisphosphate phosphatase
MSERAVFFDRDDTLMVNVPYLGDPSKVEAFAEAAAALADLQGAGFLLFVVSNQSGVGRGLITREQVHAVNLELVRQLGGD